MGCTKRANRMAIEVTCPRCKYTWIYHGNCKHVICHKCNKWFSLDQNTICDICGKECKNLRGLSTHKNWHDKEYRKKVKQKRNEKHPNWKGDNACYSSIHGWIGKYKPKPEFCEIGINNPPDFCDEGKLNPPVELANITGKYTRDIYTYFWVCKKCHGLFDKGKRISWTVEQDEALKKYPYTNDIPEILDYHTLDAMRCRASQLGYKKIKRERRKK